MGEGPGRYRTGSQDALRGNTPRPTQTAGTVRTETPTAPQVDEPTRHYIEGVVIEQMGVLAASFEKIMALRTETKAMAELSGKLHESEQTLIRAKARESELMDEVASAWKLAKRIGGIAGVVATLCIGVVAAYRDSFGDARVVATEAAEQVVEAKAVPIELKATTTDVRVAAVEARQSALEDDVQGIRTSVDRVLFLLEPPIRVDVPRKRKP